MRTDEIDRGPTARLVDEVWCQSCQHMHIGTIPVTTFRCHACGFGSWGSSVAATHAETYLDHIVHAVHHATAPAPTDPATHAEGLSEDEDDALENTLVAYDELGLLFGTSGAGAYFLAKHLLASDWLAAREDAAERRGREQVDEDVRASCDHWRQVGQDAERRLAEFEAKVRHVLGEWRDTMQGDNKATAVVRGMSVELLAALTPPEDAVPPTADHDHPPCCGPTCQGTACWDCKGTGHPHAPTTDLDTVRRESAAEALREVYEATEGFTHDDQWKSGATAVRLILRTRIDTLRADAVAQPDDAATREAEDA